ncbi:hypothetical protein [Limnospira sp. Paracas R14]|nr:hypothetical protein [Limnospira sp. Paracas R14]
MRSLLEELLAVKMRSLWWGELLAVKMRSLLEELLGCENAIALLGGVAGV